MEAIKDKARAGGKRHACPRRGRSACGVGRSGRIEGEVGRRGVLWQEKSWARREVRSPPRSTAAFLAVAHLAARIAVTAAWCVSPPLTRSRSARTSVFRRGKFFLTLPRVRVFAGGLGAGCGLDAGRAGG